MLGKTSVELGLFANPQDRQLARKDVEERGRVRNRELKMVSKDGRVLTMLLSAEPLLVNGKQCLLTSAVDITFRKRIEEALRESEKKYRLLFENAGEGIILIQGDMVKYTNPAIEEILGYSSDIITTKPFSSFIHPDDSAMVFDHHVRRMRGNRWKQAIASEASPPMEL